MGRGKKFRRKVRDQRPDPGKQPSRPNLPVVPNYINGWSFGRCDRSGDLSWPELEKEPEKFVKVINRLGEFEGSNWTWTKLKEAGVKPIELSTRNRKPVAKKNIEKILRRLGDLNIDRDTLYEIKITNRERVWCVREPLNIMRVLWWDPYHKGYEMDIKDNKNL